MVVPDVPPPAGTSYPTELTTNATLGAKYSVALDYFLKGRTGQILFCIGLLEYDTATEILDQFTIQFEIFEGDPNAGGTLRKTLPPDSVMGNAIACLIPGYGFLPPGERLRKIELLSDYAQHHLDASTLYS
jgi:hypothetical protein